MPASSFLSGFARHAQLLRRIASHITMDFHSLVLGSLPRAVHCLLAGDESPRSHQPGGPEGSPTGLVGTRIINEEGSDQKNPRAGGLRRGFSSEYHQGTFSTWRMMGIRHFRHVSYLRCSSASRLVTAASCHAWYPEIRATFATLRRAEFVRTASDLRQCRASCAFFSFLAVHAGIRNRGLLRCLEKRNSPSAGPEGIKGRFPSQLLTFFVLFSSSSALHQKHRLLNASNTTNTPGHQKLSTPKLGNSRISARQHQNTSITF
ncbi:hypothetical protein QBC45DRAFT_149073 [Copromyces sp. CBS 386.78]|nr:hypothetical protein QBC45DRAFT_149073 [Copromyces sp. CBS 386.78]